MSHVTVVRPGGGEVIGDSVDRRVEILCDHDALHATWSRFGPRREGADLHVHRRHTDLFYVLDGELTVRLGPEGERAAAPAGTLVRVPALVVHGFRNDADQDLRYVNLHAPGRGFADYLRALRDGRAWSYDQEPPPADGGRPPAEAAIGGDGIAAGAPGRSTVLLAEAEELAIAEVRGDRGGPSPLPHVHDHHLEAWYVLEGELELALGDQVHRAPAGSWAHVAPGVAHRCSVGGSGPARWLNVHAPGSGYGAVVRALRAAGDEDLAAARAGFDQRPAP